MSAHDPVVVGVDGSAAGLTALRWAADTAARQGRELRLLHAFVWPAYAAAYGLPPAAWADEDLRAHAEAVLRDAATQAHEWAPGVPVHGEVLQGTPAAMLTEASRHAAMVVVGNRGSGGFSGLLLGSVSTQVARHGMGAVIVVPESSVPAEAQPDRPRIVVGTDGSPGAEAAVRFAFGQAALRQATITVVRAWQPPPESWRDELGVLTASRADIESAEAQLLAESVQPWEEKYSQVTVEHQLVGDHPTRALTAAAGGALLLVVGARGHGGFGGLHLGSVSLQVLHHAPVPVAVVRPVHHEEAAG
jgi:nucleotide-binding universal stress UspA family protein